MIGPATRISDPLSNLRDYYAGKKNRRSKNPVNEAPVDLVCLSPAGMRILDQSERLRQMILNKEV